MVGVVQVLSNNIMWWEWFKVIRISSCSGSGSRPFKHHHVEGVVQGHSNIIMWWDRFNVIRTSSCGGSCSSSFEHHHVVGMVKDHLNIIMSREWFKIHSNNIMWWEWFKFFRTTSCGGNGLRSFEYHQVEGLV